MLAAADMRSLSTLLRRASWPAEALLALPWFAYLAYRLATSDVYYALPVVIFPLLVLAGAHAVLRATWRPAVRSVDRTLLAVTVLQLAVGALQIAELDPIFTRAEIPGVPRKVPAGFTGHHTLFGLLMSCLALYWAVRGRVWLGLLCAAAMLATRSAFAAAAFAYGFLWLVWYRVPGLRLVTVLTAASAALAGAWLFISSESQADFFYHNGRLHIWTYAVSTIFERPWLGYGIGEFSREFNLYHQPALSILGSTRWREAHNELVEYVFNVGFLGLLAFLPFAFLVARRIWRTPRSEEKELAVGLLVMLAVNAMGSFPLQIAPFATLAIYAVAWALRPLPGDTHAEKG